MISFMRVSTRRCFCLALATSAVCSNAFVQPCQRNQGLQKSCFSQQALVTPATHTTSCSMVGMQSVEEAARLAEFTKRFSTIQELNIQLDRLAQKCGSHHLQVSPVQYAAECQDLFNQVSSPNSNLKPDTVTFNTLLKAWSKVAGTLVEQHTFQEVVTKQQQKQNMDLSHIPSIPVYTARDAAEFATNMLMDVETAVDASSVIFFTDRTSYNVAIDAWAKSRSRDAPQAAERLLKKMIAHDRIKPDTLSYTGVLDAWAYSKSSPDYMDRISKIWNHIIQIHNDDTGDGLVKPNIRTVNTIINAHAKRVGEFVGGQDNDPVRALAEAKRAHTLLVEMRRKWAETGDDDYMPDVLTYTSVMNAYSRCGQYPGTMEAEALLKELEEKHEHSKNPRLQPNFRTYTSMIVAWSKTRHHEAPQKAEEILNRMERLHQQQLEVGIPTGEETTKPNCRSYTGVIQAWGRSRDPSKPQQALRILRSMREKYNNGDKDAWPNIIAYNAVIDACARLTADSDSQMQALKIAFAVLKSVELEKDMRPSSVMYATLMKAVSALLPPGDDRSRIGKSLFYKAVKAGMADYALLKYLRLSVDNEMIHDLLHDLEDIRGVIDFDKMPAEWRKNAI